MPQITYLVTLRPRGRFFFGGDKAFTSSGEAVYSAQSLYFPQQTALLGMLRLALLRQADALEVSSASKQIMIGTGFEPHAEQNNNLGKILSLSPVFVRNTLAQQDWKPIGMDFQENHVLPQKLVHNGQDVFWLEGYNPKKGELKNRWSCGDQRCNVEDFFETIESVGNKKAQDGKSEDESFFKQTSYRFKRKLNEQEAELAFALYVTFEGQQNFDKVRSVIVGADQSAFSLELTETNQVESEGVLGSKIVLTSDAYIANYETLKSYCDFILGHAVPFRYMVAPVSGKYYQPNRSPKQYNLLARGTVMYPKADKINEASAVIKEAIAFHQIGYNHFIML